VSSEEPSGALRGPRGDLLRLVRSLHAYVEELEGCGSWGLPAAESARAPKAAIDVAASAPERASDAPPQPTVAQAVKAVVHLPQASAARLEALASEASVCTKCGLHEGRRQSVFSRGGGASGLVFVGEGPGEEEDRQGLPFVGPAGQLLDRMIAAMQLERDDVYVCNVVKCRPPKNRKPDPDEMALCMPFLAEQLSILEPRVIVALGATAVQGLLGTTEGITRLRGQWKLYRGKIPVMPTFHPAYLLRTPNAKRDVWKDLQEVLRHMNSGTPRSVT
jgi:uracil-DNA glycosylase